MEKTDITIVGGGPVGLYLAGRLIQNGFACTIIEKRPEIDLHSKSLGIHPVSLDLFDKAGITDSFLEHGLKITTGLAFFDDKPVGEISFHTCPPPHPYILAIPQWKTEELLENWVHSINPNMLIRGALVDKIEDSDHSVIVEYTKNGDKHQVQSEFVIGCDGKQSFVRNSLKIPFNGSSYPDTYVMGDFDDNTDFGEKAAVYLHRDGLVESFPLPNGQRRWVAKTDHYIKKPDRLLLTKLIFQRTKIHLGECDNYMLSSFGVQHMLAESFHKGRCLLAGDAAHVVSPIGGQGMNLGWIDAEECLKKLLKIRKNPNEREFHLKEYSNKQLKMARQVAKRAEMNMTLGRKESSNVWIRTGLRMVLNSPLQHLLSHIFTMRGLGSWPV